MAEFEWCGECEIAWNYEKFLVNASVPAALRPVPAAETRSSLRPLCSAHAPPHPPALPSTAQGYPVRRYPAGITPMVAEPLLRELLNVTELKSPQELGTNALYPLSLASALDGRPAPAA